MFNNTHSSKISGQLHHLAEELHGVNEALKNSAPNLINKTVFSCGENLIQEITGKLL